MKKAIVGVVSAVISLSLMSAPVGKSGFSLSNQIVASAESYADDYAQSESEYDSKSNIEKQARKMIAHMMLFKSI